jgi:ATP-binding cassette subfamily B multidrug efflux pump
MALRLQGMSLDHVETTSLFSRHGAGRHQLVTPAGVVDRTSGQHLAVPQGEVRFENVSFGYGEERRVIDSNLTVRAGENRPDPAALVQVHTGQPAAALS